MNIMDPEKNNRHFPSVIATVITFFLIIYAVLDFSITQPKIRNNVKEVAAQFDSMKMYLDCKLPEIDSALEQHQKEIYMQTTQLKELNNISSMLIQK